MMNRFLDAAALREFPAETFARQEPFPWHDFARLLSPEGFAALYQDFPPLSLFEKHIGMERAGGQRPHDRYYLAYESSIYGKKESDEPGVVRDADLPPAWRQFMGELHTSHEYRAFSERLLGQTGMTTRYAWHVGFAGSEVSPHRDAGNKIGTHIFYFNTADDWDSAWGGATLVLGGKKTDAPNPDFADFAAESAAEIRDNRSFLFQNTPDAWHGARALTCPPGRYRRLFNVIFEESESGKREGGWASRLRKVFAPSRK